MFTKLTIKNFQAHQKLALDLDPGVTSIVGASDRGKSAVIRALRWLATNRPAGQEFIRDGGKQAEVNLSVDGRCITRQRSKSKNDYFLDDEVYKAFGNEPPEDITTLLNLDEINFQGQHDSPFWFTETAGEVSRQLNRIVDLEIIDSTLAKLDKTNRDALAEARVLSGQLEEAKEERAKLKWTRKADGELSLAQVYNGEWLQHAEESRVLADLIQTLGEHTHQQEHQRETLEAAHKVISLGDQWERIHEQVEALEKIINQMRQDEIASNRWIPEDDVQKLVDLQLNIHAVDADRVELAELIGTVKAATTEWLDLKKAAKAADQKFHDEMGEECPLCGQSL